MLQSGNPLAALPSVLAIRDLRCRMTTAVQDSRVSVADLLALDPPSVLRALRLVSAPAFGRAEPHSIVGLAAALGPSLGRRILDVSPCDIAGTGPLRQLWLHALATAIAARSLAEASGLMDPETAYLVGLIHDLPQWLHYLGLRTQGEPTAGTATDWARRWNLPPVLQRELMALMTRPQRPQGTAAQDATTLIHAAEFLAELADFWHPEAQAVAQREMVLTAASRNDLLAAQHLRHQLQDILHRVGLDTAEPHGELDPAEPAEGRSLFSALRHGNLSELVLGLLACGKADSYRAIVTATTAAALRFMNYDRATFVKWQREPGTLVVRARADLSSRRVPTTGVVPTAGELDALERAHAEGRPLRIETAAGQPAGLLGWLGADEALVVALNPDFATPGFLVLDRAATCEPIQLLCDADMANSLASTASLLIENLLLRRRRQRAQKFALTDPLTRLNNRTTGIKGLEQELLRSQRSQRSLAALMLDLDDFKRLNDIHGHLRGDAALRAIADVMSKTVRRSDSVCRYGGEEFLVVLPETGPDEAAVLAARLGTAVEGRGRQLELPLTVSIGMAISRPDDTVESLLHRADQALYASKATGRNRFSIDAET